MSGVRGDRCLILGDRRSGFVGGDRRSQNPSLIAKILTQQLIL
ncbi:MAG: hypothetical protein ACKPCM_19305 [Pseudanabaena sp.]